MFSRRDLLTASVAGGLAPTPAAALATAPALQEATRDGQREIANSVGQVESALRSALMTNTLAFGVVGKLRAQMEQFFKSNTKFPDHIEIGIAVFMDVYDWHVKHQQQLVITRQTDGRYWMQFMFTSLILRPEVDANHIGIPYDKA
jgi:hypothetical protein